jgi:uncharacterized protein YdaL
LTMISKRMRSQRPLKSPLMSHMISGLSIFKIVRVSWWDLDKKTQLISLRQCQMVKSHWTSVLSTCKTKMVTISLDTSELSEGKSSDKHKIS